MDSEKTQDLPFKDMIVDGVKISSRYGKLDEIKAMMTMVECLPAMLAPHVKSIFWDSKNGSATITMANDYEPLADFLATHMYICLYEAHQSVPCSMQCEDMDGELFFAADSASDEGYIGCH